MGITIHYRGTLNDPDTVNDLVAEVRDICEIMKWKHQVLDDDWTRPADAKLRNSGRGMKIEGNLGLKGIGFQPHKDSEWVSLYFDVKGYINSPAIRAFDLQKGPAPDRPWVFTKTQFAPVNVHITIVKLLQHIKKSYITDLEVHDEGGYWDTGSLETLTYRINSVFTAMDTLKAGLEAVSRSDVDGKSPDEFEAYIEKIIRKTMRKKRKGRTK